MVNRFRALSFMCLCAAAAGCSGLLPPSEKKRMLIPPEMERSPAAKKGNSAARGAGPAGTPKRALVRFVDQGRVWEIELPEGRSGYEVRVPIGDRRGLTAADEELFASASGQRSAGDGAASGATDASAPNASPNASLDVDTSRRSYLGAMANVNALYNSRRFELALIELVDLERDYPSDARLFAMKGSLYLKLGKPDLARASWRKALTLNPGDVVVAEALRALSEKE